MNGYITAYIRKISKRLFGVVHLRTKAPKKGTVLLSFLTSPFTFTPGKYFTDPHTNYLVCEEITRLFLEKGYDVDVINWDDTKFIPRKKYVACIDLQQSLERLSPLLGPECKKVMHIVASHAKFQNNAEQIRIEALKKRRGIAFSMKRAEKPSENARFADFLEGYGNKSVHSTYGDLASKIVPMPVPSMEFYQFPEQKDFKEARKKFLWFGGGGAILKGLDLVVEAFASMPEYTIYLVGPAPYEKEFENAYAKELALPNIIRYPRPTITAGGNTTAGRKLEDIFAECATIIFPSASEGAGASVIQAMQAGVIPIVTPSSGIAEEITYITLEPTVESIQKAIRHIVSTDPEILKKEAIRAWNFARTNHTKEMFDRKFSEFIDNTLKL